MIQKSDNLRPFPKPADPHTLKNWYFQIMFINSSRLISSFMAGVGGVGNRNICKHQSASQARAHHLELVLFLSRQRCGPVWVATSSPCLAHLLSILLK